MVALLAAVLLLAVPAVPAAAPVSSCLSCHSALLTDKKAHRPAKDCATCHVVATGAGKCKSPESTAWKLAADGQALCKKCHDVAGKTPLHPVIKSLGCVACHDPHASKNPTLLKVFPVEALCFKCHTKFDDAEFIHTAVKQGKCLGCHNPHAGEERPLLSEKRSELCLGCHKKESLIKGDTVHSPVTSGNCLGCHDPHRSDYQAQTLEKGSKLCLTCHDATNKPKSKKVVDLTKKHVHRAVKSGECTDCHLPHSSPNAKLLTAAPPALCFKCHARNDEDKFVHGAVKLGDCAVCHEPHATDNRGLLTEPTTAGVCFKCHEDDITGRAFVHKPVAEGKCLDCHEAHGADHRFNLKTGSGTAACTGCHKGKGEGKVQHKALTEGGCTACHDPHASGNNFQLIKPVNQLCQTCHADKLDGMHASSFAAGGHLISGDWDPRRKNGFSCTSCHNPHGSDNPRLYYFGRDNFEMCDACHGDKTGVHPELKDIHRRPPKTVPVARAPEVKP